MDSNWTMIILFGAASFGSSLRIRVKSDVPGIYIGFAVADLIAVEMTKNIIFKDGPNLMSITGGIMWLILFLAIPANLQYAMTVGDQDREFHHRVVNSSNNSAVGFDSVDTLRGENTEEDIIDNSSDCNTNPARVIASTHDVPTSGSSETSDEDGEREFPHTPIHAEKVYVNRATKEMTRDKRTLTFTDPATLLLIFGLGTPLQLDSESVIVGLFTKMIYTLPTNSTDFTQPGIYFARTKSRWNIYKSLEKAAELYGFGSGKSCLLRTICEVAATPFNSHHGLFGQLVQAFLSPSSTSETYDEYSDREYHAAERLGRNLDQNCQALYPECERNVLDIFSTTVVTASKPTSTTSATTTEPATLI